MEEGKWGISWFWPQIPFRSWFIWVAVWGVACVVSQGAAGEEGDGGKRAKVWLAFSVWDVSKIKCSLCRLFVNMAVSGNWTILTPMSNSCQIVWESCTWQSWFICNLFKQIKKDKYWWCHLSLDLTLLQYVAVKKKMWLWIYLTFSQNVHTIYFILYIYTLITFKQVYQTYSIVIREMGLYILLRHYTVN